MCSILRDTLSDVINGQPDMTIVGECVECDEAMNAVERARPDVVIFGRYDREVPAMCELLRRQTAVAIIGIEQEGRRARLFEKCHAHAPIGEPSLETFLELIRSAAGRR